jgi:hypothetical protein
MELWSEFGPFFMATVPHAPKLGKSEKAFYQFFGFLLLHSEFVFDPDERQRWLREISADGRHEISWVWMQQTNNATDYGAKVYRERLRSLLHDLWPQENDLKDDSTSNNLGQLALGCSTEFPDAVKTVIPLISRVTSSGHAGSP